MIEWSMYFEGLKREHPWMSGGIDSKLFMTKQDYWQNKSYTAIKYWCQKPPSIGHDRMLT